MTVRPFASRPSCEQAELRKVVAAGAAPLGPEVEDDDLAAEDVPGQRLAVEPGRPRGEFRRGLADEGVDGPLAGLLLFVANLRLGQQREIAGGGDLGDALLDLLELADVIAVLVADLDLGPRGQDDVVEQGRVHRGRRRRRLDLVNARQLRVSRRWAMSIQLSNARSVDRKGYQTPGAISRKSSQRLMPAGIGWSPKLPP